jgi:hypothetical protein
VDDLALQETWNIQHPELYTITGFHPLILSTCINSSGGEGWASTLTLNNGEITISKEKFIFVMRSNYKP